MPKKVLPDAEAFASRVLKQSGLGARVLGGDGKEWRDAWHPGPAAGDVEHRLDGGSDPG
jgi:hypothetical protein